MTELQISPAELKRLLVKDLEIIDEDEFDRAQHAATRLRVPLDRILVERGRVPSNFLYGIVAQSWETTFVDLRLSEVKPEALRAIPEEMARRCMLVPFDLKDRVLHVAMQNPRDKSAITEIQQKTRLQVQPYLATDPAIQRAFLLYRGNLLELIERSVTDEQHNFNGSSFTNGNDASASALVTRILEYAAVSRASDIHIEPYELEVIVRYRVDGLLQEVTSMPAAMMQGLVSRVKVMAGMRIDERRAPQDGRFEANLGGFKMDLRVSSLPTHWGEKIVMRVLSKENIFLDIEDLGMGPGDMKIFLNNVLRPYGMILITGPTGSGKSTTLYAAVQRLGNEKQNVVNISTIEDPIEYTMGRVNQVQVNSAAGVEFSSGLRALLRQDPDIIMVGEIRDRETAEIAVRSSLVGRLLLSSLHTNDSTSAVPRLLDMGIESFLLASTLSLVVAQRLVRRICRHCRESYVPDDALLRMLIAKKDFARSVCVLQDAGSLSLNQNPFEGVRLYRGKGCHQCLGTGFRGRLGVFELFEITEEIKQMIMDRRDATTMRNEALASGMKSLFEDGLAKALIGETTIEEIYRVAM